jgi:hypothetical protein
MRMVRGLISPEYTGFPGSSYIYEEIIKRVIKIMEII